MELNFCKSIERYKAFVKENKEVVDALNQLRKELRFYMIFDEKSDSQIIAALADGDDVEDIGEIIGKTGFEVSFMKEDIEKNGVEVIPHEKNQYEID